MAVLVTMTATETTCRIYLLNIVVYY